MENKFSDDERLYFELLQNNIGRMNSNSAQAKGWCIAIVSALLAIYSQTENACFLWFCLLPIAFFCFIDTLYLQQEHKFIEMYNSYIKNENNKPKVFEMPMKNYSKSLKGFFKAFFSWSVVFVYPAMAIIISVILIFNK